MHSQLVKDSMPSIFSSLVNGSISSNREIQYVCSQALSFLITQRQIYNQNEEEVKYDEISKEIDRLDENAMELRLKGSPDDMVKA